MESLCLLLQCSPSLLRINAQSLCKWRYNPPHLSKPSTRRAIYRTLWLPELLLLAVRAHCFRGGIRLLSGPELPFRSALQRM